MKARAKKKQKEPPRKRGLRVASTSVEQEGEVYACLTVVFECPSCGKKAHAHLSAFEAREDER